MIVARSQKIADPKIMIEASIQRDPNPWTAPGATIRAMPGSVRNLNILVYGQTAGRHSNGMLSTSSTQATAAIHARKINPYLKVRDRMCVDLPMPSFRADHCGEAKETSSWRMIPRMLAPDLIRG